MKPIRDIIVKVPEAYKTTIELKGGFKLYLDENIKQVKDTNRYGIVQYIPEDCVIDVRVGDQLFFHHNIVSEVVTEGGIMESPFLVSKRNRTYRVPVDMDWPLAYAVIRNGEFIVLDGICFVKPIYTKKYDTTIFVPDNEKEVTNIGKMIYPDKNLLSQGIDNGSTVLFETDSEYGFKIGDEEMYCMFSRWIIGEAV